jgi:DNA-binding MarR family transcriptional regulator
MHRPGRIRSDRWYNIALACRDVPRTIPAIAAEMGVRAGSIQSLIDSMRRENLLEEGQSDARGVALTLTRQGRAELRKAMSTDDVEQLLASGERLVFVMEDGHGITAEALAQLASDPSFRWAARVDGPVKWIASFGPGDAAAADRAANALVKAGARAVVGRTDAVLNAERLAQYADRLGAVSRGAIAGGRQLPKRS